jgi:hypothetical protein
VERGRIIGGDVVDSDYMPERKSVAEATGTRSYAETVRVGWELPASWSGFFKEAVLWVALERAGLSIRMENGVQILPDPDSVPGRSLKGLDSRYHSRWRGVWFGIEPTVKLGDGDVAFLVGINPRVGYSAEGTWNLRSDLAQPRSFSQEAHGWGGDLTARYSRHVGKHITGRIQWEYAMRSAKRGFDHIYYSDGRQGRLALQRVSWTTQALDIGASLAF